MDNSKVVGLRLIDGNEVICTEHEGLTGAEFSAMLRVAIHPSGQATMLPYVDIESFDNKIKIKEEHIILRYKPEGSILGQYKKFQEIMKQQKTGIITPNKEIIK